MSYKTTQEFLRMFGYKSLKDLPELPKYKLDENRQIVIDELVEENDSKEEKEQEEQIDNTKNIEEEKKEEEN